ncbi:MAG: ABC transporter permease subunit [Acidobacteriota bacterium]|nr:ABC transporter permease subunit [Acidobacteriota bacterium]
MSDMAIGPRAAVPRLRDALGAIALNTFREAIRDRILYLLLAFALVLIVAARLLSLLTVGSEDKIIKDLGLAAISIFGVLTAVFVGVSLVFKEVERRTVYTLLANPVRRWQFVSGKYLGLLLVLGMNVTLMSLTLGAVLLVRGQAVLPLLPAIWLILVELALITAFSILFSSFTNPILAATGTAAIYIVGHLAWSFELLKQRLGGGIGGTMSDVLYWALPNLGLLNIRAEVVNQIAVPASRVAWATGYGLAYALGVLVLACVIFERRDFN